MFHDIGIWKNHCFAYLEPSTEKAKKYLLENNKAVWIEKISLMIDMHHKMSRYSGLHKETVKTFRRVDWVDISKEILKFKLNQNDMFHINKDYPNLDFHGFLAVQTIKNLFKSPLKPLPMFKK